MSGIELSLIELHGPALGATIVSDVDM